MEVPWFIKHEPTTIEEIENIYPNETEKLKEWILNWKNGNENTHGTILLGSFGCGKTTMAKVLTKELGFDNYILDSSQSRSQKNMIEWMENVILCKNVKNLLQNKKKPIAIIVDDLDGIDITEKTGLNELSKLIHISNSKKNKRCKKNLNVNWIGKALVIFISSETKNKTINELQKYCNSILLNKPYKNNTIKMLKNISKKEKLNIDTNQIENIFERNGNDLRKSILELEILSCTKLKLKNEPIIKWNGKGLIEIVEQMFLNKNISNKDLICWHHAENSLLPLLIHENISLGLNIKKNKFYSTIINIFYYLCLADTIENKCTLRTSESSQRLHAFFGVLLPVLTCRTLDLNNNFKAQFTELLGRMSVQHATLRHLNSFILRLKNDSFDRNIWFHLGDLVKNSDKSFTQTLINKYSSSKDELYRLHQAGNSSKIIMDSEE